MRLCREAMFPIRRSFVGTVCGVSLLAAGGLAACAPTSGPPPDLTWKKARIHYNLGLEHLQKGRTALAIRELRQAEEMDPHDPWTPLALAEAYRRKGRLEEAEGYLLRTLELQPDLQAAQLNLGALYIQAGRYEEAVARLQPLADDPTFPAPWRALTNLGWAYFKLGENAQARRQLELALDYRPEYWKASLNLGILEAAEGHPLEALRLFERVLDQKPGPRAEAEVHYRMAEIYVSLGRRDEAIEHLSASVQRLPRSPWGKRSAEYLKILR